MHSFPILDFWSTGFAGSGVMGSGVMGSGAQSSQSLAIAAHGAAAEETFTGAVRSWMGARLGGFGVSMVGVGGAFILGGAVPGVAQEPSPLRGTPEPERVAQLLYPSADEAASLKVIGQGEAVMAADLARLTFSFSTEDPSSYDEGFEEPEEAPTSALQPSALQPSALRPSALRPSALQPSAIAQLSPDSDFPKPLTRERLKPALAALKKAGVMEQQITVEIAEGSSLGTVQVRLEKPTGDRIDQLVDAVQQALDNNTQVFFSDFQQRFELRDCQPLEVKAYQGAIANARRRAEAMAKALGVSLAGTPRVAESPFNLLSPASCNESSPFEELMNLGSGGLFGNPEPPKPEVKIKRDIFVTFPIR